MRNTLLTVAGLFIVACNPTQVCSPGASVACVGVGGCSGGQRCLADGSGFDECLCGGTDAGMSDVPPTSDTPTPVDAGPCDPVANTGCGATERCAWFYDAAGGGEGRCVPEGAVAVGGTCMLTPPGTDDCVGGSGCIESVCRPTCSPSRACDGGSTCVHYDGVFAAPDEGFCTPTCNPVTQLLSDGSMCPDGRGCFAAISETTVVFVCAPAAFDGTHGDLVDGTVFFNSCAPGHVPVTSPLTGETRCAALCLPVTTSAASPSGAGGMSPHTCADRGAAGADCLYGWLLSESTGDPDPLLDTIGVCLDLSGRMIDDDGDGASDDPWTSCAVRSATDDADPDSLAENAETGCTPFH